MGRDTIRVPREDWRERLFWTSLAGALIALLLFGLVSLAEWGESTGTKMAGVSAQPGSTSLMADSLIPPPAPPNPFSAPLPQLPAVGTAPRAGRAPRPECGRGADEHTGRPEPLFAVRGELCAIAQ
jgi:hypothetical protein